MNDRKRRWDFDKRMRENFIGALKSKTRAIEIGEEIERREWRERAVTYLKWLSDARTSVVNDLSNTSCLLTDERRRWSERLERLDVSSPGAERELTDLLTEVKDRREFWRLMGAAVQLPRLPEWLTASSLPGRSQASGPTARRIGLRHLEGDRSARLQDATEPSLNHINLMLTPKARERDEFEQQAQANEHTLASIVSSVEHLITLHQGYVRARSRS